jgi:tRNA threonylcarbamoyladenosine biosynthesis protein TsaE
VGLGVKGTVNSPTFVVMKQYALEKNKNDFNIKNIYHIDTYRVEENDIMDLGWSEIITNKENISIIEWPEKIENIIPINAAWFSFESLDENRRKITLKNK